MTTARRSRPPLAARPLAVVGDYVRLTKPRIISLLLVTTAGAMFVAAGGVPDGWLLFWTMVGGYLAAGGANAINHYIDRDIDGRMCAHHRAAGGRGPGAAGARAGLRRRARAPSARWCWACSPTGWPPRSRCWAWRSTSGVYTLWLKRTTVHNIVIGGSAGRGAAAGGLGGGDRRPEPVGLAAVRDRLLLDAARTSGRWR